MAHLRSLMYLASYVTALVPSCRGSCAAGTGGREPADDAGDLDRRSGNRGGAGGAAADCPPGGIAAPAGAAGGRASRGPPGSTAAGLQPPPQPLAEIDEWLGRYRALWEQRLDALHTEIARGKR